MKPELETTTAPKSSDDTWVMAIVMFVGLWIAFCFPLAILAAIAGPFDPGNTWVGYIAFFCTCGVFWYYAATARYIKMGN